MEKQTSTYLEPPPVFEVKTEKGNSALDSETTYYRVRYGIAESPWMKSLESAWARLLADHAEVREELFIIACLSERVVGVPAKQVVKAKKTNAYGKQS